MSDRLTSLSTCWVVTRTDGVTFRLTDNDQVLTVGGYNYVSAVGYAPSAIQNNSELSPDNVDLIAVLDDNILELSDLRAGKFDYAEVELFLADWSTGTKVRTLIKGKLGAVSVKDNQLQVELNNMAALYGLNIGGSYSTLCAADLGDTKCKVDLSPAAWAQGSYIVGDEVSSSNIYLGRIFVCTTAGTTDVSEPTWNTTLDATTADGTVVWTTKEGKTKRVYATSSPDRLTFFDTTRTEPDGYWDGGLATWISGANINLSMDIKEYILSTGSFTLFEPMPEDIGLFDEIEITVGCGKTATICKTKFDNLINIRAFPHIPGVQKLLG